MARSRSKPVVDDVVVPAVYPPVDMVKLLYLSNELANAAQRVDIPAVLSLGAAMRAFLDGGGVK